MVTEGIKKRINCSEICMIDFVKNLLLPELVRNARLKSRRLNSISCLLSKLKVSSVN